MSNTEKKPVVPNTHAKPSWLAQQWQRVRGRASAEAPGNRDVIAANVAENAQNVVVGKNIIQIGSLKLPRTLAILLGVGVVVATVALVWISVNAARVTDFVMRPTAVPPVTATPVPDRMGGTFNIAVADFGEIDASGVISNSQDGQTLSAWVYDALAKAYATNSATQRLGQVEIWNDSAELAGKNQPLGVIASTSAKERRLAAEALAQRINATMVIYGTIDGGVSPADLWLEFYVVPDLQRTLDPAVGRHNLGGPIGISLPIDATNPLSAISVANALNTRTSLLFWLTAGMTYELLGEPTEALQSFQQANQTLEAANEESGRDLVNFFMGRQYLIMQQLDKAAEAYEQALFYNDEYARAKIGLGGVYFSLAQPTGGQEPSAENASNLTLALRTYEEAIVLAEADDDPLIGTIAHLALASALRVKAQDASLAGALSEAEQAFGQVLAEIEPLLPMLAQEKEYQLLAQGYESLGAAHLQLADVVRQLGDADGRRTHLAAAIEAFAACIAQGQQAPFNQTLNVKIIKNSCQPYHDIAQKALVEAEE